MFKSFDKKNKDCQVCYSEIDKNNYALYRDVEDGDWKSSIYCKDCIEILLKTTWTTYVNQIEKADCAAALKRAVDKGPPINLRDPKALPCENKTNEVHSLYYDNEIQSAKLNGSYTGKKRIAWWDELKNAIKVMEENEAKEKLENEKEESKKEKINKKINKKNKAIEEDSDNDE